MTLCESLLTGPSAYPTALNARKRGSDWVEIVWEDYADCKTTFTSYFMTFESKTLPANQVQVVQVPLNCTTNEEQLTVFDSKNCPELFIFGSCSVYQVTVAATIFDIYNSSTSSTENFNTEPRKSTCNDCATQCLIVCICFFEF